jgi:hypothetical protein
VEFLEKAMGAVLRVADTGEEVLRTGVVVVGVVGEPVPGGVEDAVVGRNERSLLASASGEPAVAVPEVAVPGSPGRGCGFTERASKPDVALAGPSVEVLNG